MRIFFSSILFLAMFINLSAQSNKKTATKIVSADLLKSVMKKDSNSTLLVVLKTYIPELIRINAELNSRNSESKNYNYLLRRKNGLLDEKARQDQYNDHLIDAFKLVSYIDYVYFVSDTSIRSVLNNLNCDCLTIDRKYKKIDLKNTNFFYMENGKHPSTGTSGYYFYSKERKYLDTPFPDFIAARTPLESILKGLFPKRQSLKKAKSVINQINNRFYRAWNNHLTLYKQLQE